MSTSGHHHQNFSDAAIRGFLLAQLSPKQQPAFESELFVNSQLEQRVRLTELELVDDYVADRLESHERVAFRHKFLVIEDREKKLAVSTALQKLLSAGVVSQPANSLAKPVIAWPRLAWRIAFAILALAVLLAGALVIRKEPQVVKRMIPKRLRPVAVAPPSPQAAHHPTNSSESPEHRDESSPVPAHEASPETIVLRANVTTYSSPFISLAQAGSNAVRFELLLERSESATFSVVVTTSSGEIIHDVPAIRVENADRIDFDVPVNRLKPGDFQVTLTRIGGESGVERTYYFRVH